MESIHIKATPEIKELLQAAAIACGLTVSAFVRQAAVQRAEKILGKRPTLPVHTANRDKKPKGEVHWEVT